MRSFDPRANIRDTIGYTHYMHGRECSTVSVYDEWDDIVYVPLYMPGEVRTGNLPEMPFIEMVQVTTPAITTDVGGGVKIQDAYLDFNIYYTDSETMPGTTFGKTIANELGDKIFTYRSSIPSCYFMEVINDGREIIEKEKKIIFHKIVEVHCKNYEN